MKSPYLPYGIILVLLLPALLLRLGYMPHIDDEAIRALVALEMRWSDNWVTPTLHGDYYYNKPPLWNWLLALLFGVTGSEAEWVSRLGAVVCLLGYAATIYYFTRAALGRRLAFINALAFVTCGRVVFWDSLVGLIDISFSWVMFTLFMVVYHFFERRQWWQLFIISYQLMAVGFMLKGLPAIVFQGISLLSYFVYRGEFRRLFSAAHVVGGLLGLVLPALYYYGYHQYNDLETVVSTLLNESSRRTVVHFGLAETLLQIVTFPFELLYHFLPWSLLIIFAFRPGAWRFLRSDRFAGFLAVCLLFNILPYWTSPEVYPRYLLMLVPLLFTLGLYYFRQLEGSNSRFYPWFQRLLLLLAVILAVVWAGPLVSVRLQQLPWAIPTALLLLGWSLWLLTKAWREAEQRWLWVIALLLTFRLGFDWFGRPDRLANDFGEKCRQSSLAVGQRWAGKPLFVYHHTLMQPTNSYYLERGYGGIIPRKVQGFSQDEYYLVNEAQFPESSFVRLDSFFVRHGQLTYYLVQLTDTLLPPAVLLPAESLTPLPTPDRH